MKRLLVLLVLAFATTAVAVQAATAASGNQLLAKGTVTESVSPSDWTISFNIHARGDGLSSEVDVTPGTGAPTTSLDGSVYSGSYTDPSGGTDVYVIGAVFSGPVLFGAYQAYVVHEGGPYGADRSWVLPTVLPDLASAQALCGTISSISPIFAVDGSKNVLFKV